MADFAAPIVDWLLGVLRTGTPALLLAKGLEPFCEYRKSWTGIAINWPPLAVMARTTNFDPEGTGYGQTHIITIKFGVNGADSDDLTVAAMAYAKAINDAIDAAGSAWLPQMRRVFVGVHDYGPLFERGGNFAKFPEMHLEIEATEL